MGTARDHLANERTFLAWYRTSISLISFGLGIAKFAPENYGLIFAGIFILLGMLMLAHSWMRYHSVMEALERGEFRIQKNKHVLVVLTGMFSLLAVAYLWHKYQQ